MGRGQRQEPGGQEQHAALRQGTKLRRRVSEGDPTHRLDRLRIASDAIGAVLALNALGCSHNPSPAAPPPRSAEAPTPSLVNFAGSELPSASASVAELASIPGFLGRKVPLPARWELQPSSQPARLAGLSFGMSFESAADAQPELRDGMDVELDVKEFYALAKRRPDLHLLDDPDRLGGGGDRFEDHKSQRAEGLLLGGVVWKLQFRSTMGLSGFFLKFDDETAREAVVKAWGTPAIDANWKVWTDPASHTQAAFTECGYASYSGSTPIGKRTCTLELMPMQTVDELVQTLFPNRRSRVGATSMGEDFIGRPFKSDDDELTEFLLPLPASFYTRVEIKLDSENQILAYRTELSYGADSTRATYLGALAAVLGPDAKNVARQGCAETKLDRTPVLTCDFERSLVVTVGDWKGR